MSLRCLLVDDEPNAVSLLDIFIAESTDWQVVAKCFDGQEAKNILKKTSVDIIFLDINMPKLSGIELAGLLPKTTKVVFTTAHKEHALESYNFETIDYILKPVTLKRFLAAQTKIETYFENKYPQKNELAKDDQQDYFFFKSGKALKKILLKDIRYFESDKEYVKVITADSSILIYRRLKDIEAQLREPFFRIHHSFIINVTYVNKIEDNHVFIGTERIPISGKFRDKFMTFLKKRVF